jgi:hypothetical protein
MATRYHFDQMKKAYPGNFYIYLSPTLPFTASVMGSHLGTYLVVLYLLLIDPFFYKCPTLTIVPKELVSFWI